MVKANNPAGRLYLILDDIRLQPNNASLRQAWAHALGIQVPNDDEVSQLIVLEAEVIKLTEEIKDLITKQEVDHSLYLKPFIKIQRVFTYSFGHQVSDVKQFLDDGAMIGLEHCSELLSRKAGEEVIELEVLTQLQSDVDTLVEKVLNTNLSGDLKSLLLDSLHYIRQAILNYRIHGARGIEGAVKVTLGSIQYYTLHGQNEEAANENDKQTVRDFIDLLEKLLSIVANALNIGQLVSGVAIRLLGP